MSNLESKNRFLKFRSITLANNVSKRNEEIYFAVSQPATSSIGKGTSPRTACSLLFFFLAV